MRSRLFPLIFTLVIGWSLLASGMAGAQVIPGIPLPSASTNPYWGVRTEGIYTTAPVVLDGAVLFRVAAPVNAPDRMPINLRASYVDTVLGQLTAMTGSGSHTMTVYDPQSVRVHIRREASQALLGVTDAKHSDPLPVLTVTSVDAKYNALTVDELATEWQGILQRALQQALLKRQPAVERRSFDVAVRVGVGLIALTLIIWAVVAALRRRIDNLEEQVHLRGRALEAEQSQPVSREEERSQRRRRFLALALRAINPAQRLGMYRALAATLLWSLVLAWFSAAIWVLLLFPQTTPLARTMLYRGLHVAAIWIITGLLNRILDMVIARLPGVWHISHMANSEDRARRLLRASTITQALAGFKTFILLFVAVLATLARIGVPIGSVLTIGGVAAIGVTLAAQNLIRDVVSGFLVLMEDQYVVGDYIRVNAQGGLVERLTLRMVQIRDEAGNLITIPHSSVTTVVNQSRNWSRVDYRVPVDPSADVSKALDLVRAVIEDLARDDAWRDAVLDPIEWIGVEAISRDWVVIRACMKTAPLRQFELRRQINLRIGSALADAGIGLGAPIPEHV